MKYQFFYFFIVSLFLNKISSAQDGSKLNVGDNAPNLVLTSTNNSIQSFSFPYQNKVVLLFFWSSSVSKSKENIYKYKRLNSKYSDLEYKSCDGFEVISVALQSDKTAWAESLINFGLLKMNNCIAQKGYNDVFVKSYKITQTPTSFLIDEFGKVLFINPSLKTIIDYLDQRRNSQFNADVQTKLSGKIMYGNQQLLTPLANEKIWFLNDKNDTIQSVILDEKGKFLLRDVNTSLNLTIYLKFSSKINEDQTVFLTSENGEIVSPFIKNEIGYEYTLLDVEMPYLKPLFDNEPIVKTDKGLKELYISSQLFKDKTSVLSKEAMAKLNSVIAKLNANPKTRVEIISHTDCNGDAKLNTSMTLKQSNSIAAYLLLEDISQTRIKTIGKGESEILNKCKDGVTCSEAEHNINRRTEFKFFQLP